MNGPKFQLEFTAEAEARMQKARELLSARVMLAAVASGMEEAASFTVSDIQEKRLTGVGPFPVIEGRLGESKKNGGHLRRSVRATRPYIVADQLVVVGIGSNVKYAAIHEFGGEIKRTTKDGSVRLRTDRSGNLIRQANNGSLAVFAKKTHKRFRQVGYVGGKQYTIKIPARAPFGHGIADNAPTFTRLIAKSLQEKLDAL